MSFNRLPYDECAYKKALEQSTTQNDYSFYIGAHENSTECSIGEGISNPPHSTKVEVESELWGINRNLSRCPENKYNKDSVFETVQVKNPRLCQGHYNITPTNMRMPESAGLTNLEDLIKRDMSS